MFPYLTITSHLLCCVEIYFYTRKMYSTIDALNKNIIIRSVRKIALNEN